MRRIQSALLSAALLMGLSSPLAWAQTYTSSGGLPGQFQQLSPRTPVIDIAARGTFNFDPNNMANSTFDFVLAGTGDDRGLGDFVRVTSQGYVGNQNGQLVFRVQFDGVNGGRANIPSTQARLVLVQPQSIAPGTSPRQMQLRFAANTSAIQFDLPIQLSR